MENELMIPFKKPYTFEGDTYKELDLSGLEDLTAADLMKAQRMMSRAGNVAAVAELDYTYCLQLAAAATELPIEFFDLLPAREAVKVKNLVSNFLLSGD